MEDLFNTMEKKMDELNQNHSEISTLIENFRNNLNQKETCYKTKFCELKSLFDIYKQCNSLNKNKNEIENVSTKLSKASLYEVELISKLVMEKSKECNNQWSNSNATESTKSLLSSSLVSQISEIFARNPTLCESPKQRLAGKMTLRHTSSPMVTSTDDMSDNNTCLSNKYKNKKLTFVETPRLYGDSATPIKLCVNSGHKFGNVNSNTNWSFSREVSSERASDSSYVDADASSESITSSFYSSKQFFERSNPRSLVSPLSSGRSKTGQFSTLHYYDPHIAIDVPNDCLKLKSHFNSASEFSGSLEKSVVEQLIKHWKPRHVFLLRAKMSSYFCRRLYNSLRLIEIRKIIKECERIIKSIGNIPTNEDEVLIKALNSDIKLHKDIIHNIFFETTLNSKLIMISEVLEKPINISRNLKKQPQRVNLNRKYFLKSTQENNNNGRLNQSHPNFISNKVKKSLNKIEENYKKNLYTNDEPVEEHLSKTLR